MHNKQKTKLVTGLFALCLSMLPGCWAEISAPQTESLIAKQLFPADKDSGEEEIKITQRWWESFNDPQLNELIAAAELDNLSIQQAWFKLKQSHQQAIIAGADAIPDVGTNTSAGRSVSKSGSRSRVYSNSFSAALSVSYELDLWGRVNSLSSAAILDTQASEQDLRSAALTVASEIASNWFKLVRQHATLEVLDRQKGTNQAQLKVITRKYKSGQVNISDVLQQQQLLESTNADRLSLLGEIAVTKNALAVLTGTDPTNFELEIDSSKLPQLPQKPSLALPGTVLNSRPDVAAALLRVKAADQRLAASIASRFPRLSLTAQASTSSDKVHDLFDSWLASIAANLAAPIIDGGKLKADIRSKRAAAAESFAAYHEKLLKAVSEVRNAVINEDHKQQYIESLTKQLELSGKSLEQIRQQYLTGSGDFTALLAAQLSFQGLEKQLLVANQQLLGHRIDLYKSLSSGWVTPKAEIKTDRVTGPVAGILDAK